MPKISINDAMNTYCQFVIDCAVDIFIQLLKRGNARKGMDCQGRQNKKNVQYQQHV